MDAGSGYLCQGPPARRLALRFPDCRVVVVVRQRFDLASAPDEPANASLVNRLEPPARHFNSLLLFMSN